MTERIFLIGYRGTGKSTIAQLLANRLGWSWSDADQCLEQCYQATIRQIFEREGESGFRSKESAILEVLATNCKQIVIATGGGVVMRPANRALLKTGLTVWLRADAKVIWQRMQADTTTTERRPDLAQGGLAEIEELLRARQPLYQACADWTIDTSQLSPDQVAGDVLAWLQAGGHVDILKT